MNYPPLIPYVFYEDGAATVDFLQQAFGFRERMRETNDDGSLGHCELELGDAVIFVSGLPAGHRNPAHLGNVTGGIYLSVPDVDKHFERAEAAGATIQGKPEDQPYGARNYGALDPEGHQWWFSTPIPG